MLRIRIKRPSGAYASSRQDTDYAGAGVVRSLASRSDRGSLVVQTSMCIEAGLSRCMLG